MPNETVLVVEDEPDLRALICKSLQAEGYRVLQAENGESALNVIAAASQRIGIMITDIVMPKMNGIKLAERVRALSLETRILFVSGYADRVFERAGSFEPEANFIEKPFDLDVLLAKVRSVLAAS